MHKGEVVMVKIAVLHFQWQCHPYRLFL